MIAYTDLTGVDETLARRIIAVARSIAPCLTGLDGEPKSDALAILLGVIGDNSTNGPRGLKSQRIGPAGVEYQNIATWFSDDDRSALRALCSSASSSTGPIGQFPRAARVLTNMWPEEADC